MSTTLDGPRRTDFLEEQKLNQHGGRQEEEAIKDPSKAGESDDSRLLRTPEGTGRTQRHPLKGGMRSTEAAQ